jgi:hypothetical protein
VTDSTPATAAPCPQGRTDYEACFAPFRYCPVKGCGRAESSTPDAASPPTYLDGLRDARAVVERQTDLTDLVHFDRPSDFRKGILTCLVALDDAIARAESQ